MQNDRPVQVAVLADYQGVALQSADWSLLNGKASITVFRDHLSDSTALIERLKPFNVLSVMRERTPLTRAIIEQLPNLKLIASTGSRNASIDLAAATEHGITVCYTGYSSHGAHLVSKEELFRTADIVTIHLVLSARTKGTGCW